MNKTKFVIATLFISVLGFSSASAQAGMVKKTASAAKTEQTETFKVLGNCDMCKRTIEKAATAAGAVKANWDVDADLLTVSFNPANTSVDKIQKAVAQSGYDNAGYKAPDASYNGLHKCCQYDRTGAPGGAKSCDAEGEGKQH